MAPSSRGSVLPMHLSLNVIASSREFDATKSRVAVNNGNECAKSRSTRCLSWRIYGVKSMEVRCRSFNDCMLPEMILGPT